MGSSLKSMNGGPQMTGAEGHYETASRVDGVQRMVSFRRVAEFPLYVSVLRASDEALASWRLGPWNNPAR